jgi:hypothetical protein
MTSKLTLLLALLLAVPPVRAEHGGSNSWDQQKSDEHRAGRSRGAGVPTRTRIILPPNHGQIPSAPPRQSRESPPTHRNAEGVSTAPGRLPYGQATQAAQKPVEWKAPQTPAQGAPRVDWNKETAPLKTSPPRTWEQPARPPKEINDRHLARPPAKDEHGDLIRALPIRHAPDHERIVANRAFMANVAVYNTTEVQPNHYYWHTDNGLNYCHYHDRSGTHWYGFYAGTTYYWSRYEANHWWWYDPAYTRWLYWDDGYWWWQSPTQQVYVYGDNNSYIAYSSATAAPPAVTAPAVSTQTEVQNGDTLYSADGSRMVQIFGDRNEAFLYERYAGEEPQFLSFLGRDIARVQFSDTEDPAQLQILLHFKNGTFSVLDNRGASYQAPSPATSAPPADLPGPPTP